MSKLIAALGTILAASVLATWAAAAPANAHTQNLQLIILAGDQVYAGGSYAVAPGVPVRVTITNFTRDFHTFTAPALHLNKLIAPATNDGVGTTTFTFTPHKWGTFTWHCLICPSGMHGRKHHMDGTLWVIERRSVLP